MDVLQCNKYEVFGDKSSPVIGCTSCGRLIYMPKCAKQYARPTFLEGRGHNKFHVNSKTQFVDTNQVVL